MIAPRPVKAAPSDMVLRKYQKISVTATGLLNPQNAHRRDPSWGRRAVCTITLAFWVHLACFDTATERRG